MFDLADELRGIVGIFEGVRIAYALAGQFIPGSRRPRGARPRRRMTGADVAAALGTVSALRRLCLRLPHVPTPRELGLLKRFRELVAAPEQATENDVEAVLAGWSSWWRDENVAELIAMARRLPGRMMESDRHLATLAMAARMSASQS